jgi:O-succinylbenzoate synthase
MNLAYFPDASMRMDATKKYTPAKHKTFQSRLNRLKIEEENYWLYNVLSARE